MSHGINKTMDREDLLTPAGQRLVAEMSELCQEIERRHLPITSWYGHLPEPPVGLSPQGLKSLAKNRLGRSTVASVSGGENRGGASYKSVPGIAGDHRHPWSLYREAFWVMTQGPQPEVSVRVLDAGGTASLFLRKSD